MNPARVRAYIYLLIVSLIWGIAGPVIKLTLKGLPPDIFLLYRFVISGVLALPFIFGKNLKYLKSKENIVTILIYAILNSSVGLGLLFWGTDQTSLISMSLLSLFAPILTIMAGYLILKDHITNREKIGTFVTLAGSGLVILEPIIKFDGVSGHLTGNLLVLGSIVCGTISVILLKKLLRNDVDPLFLSSFSFFVGLVTMIPVVLFLHPFSYIQHTIYSAPFPYHLGVFYMAIFSGTIAYALVNLAQKSIEVSEAAVFAYIYPIISAVLAVALLGEKMTPLTTFGAAVTISGIFLAEWKKKRYNS